MCNSESIYADLFPGKGEKPAGLPHGCSFVCAYSLLIGAIPFEEAVFFRRTEKTDELWIATDDDIVSTISPIMNGIQITKNPAVELRTDFDCVLAVKRNDNDPAPWLSLLDRLTWSRTGLCRPQKFLAPGLADISDFSDITDQTGYGADFDSGNAMEQDKDIIRIACENDSSAVQNGIKPELWQVNCPDRNHLLFVNTAHSSAGF